MEIQFYKYQGTGNDFIIVSDWDDGVIELSIDQIKKLCDRKFGIGSDGLIVIGKSDLADFKMDFYNPDGSQSFCGNGSRCAVMFASQHNLIQRKGSFIAVDGIHDFELVNDQLVKIQIRDLSNFETSEDHFFLDTGSPHYIMYTHDVSSIDIMAEAKKIRYNERFKSVGTNVNFVEELECGLRVRTYERGVEDETLSCGSGVTAVALSHYLKTNEKGAKRIFTQGGELSVEFEVFNSGFISTPIFMIHESGIFSMKLSKLEFSSSMAML